MSTALYPEPRLLDAVQRWRFEQLEAAGYPPSTAVVLAEQADVDLHLAVRLLEEGCTPETALRILL